MSAFTERREQDVQKLKDLQQASGDRIRVTGLSGRPPNEIELALHFKTAPSRNYPAAVQEVTRLAVSLPARYPFVEPSVTIKTPILHPNVYTSGLICLGVKWMPSFGLDLLVRRIVQIITFDSTVLNEASPANSAALTWYRQAKRSHPDSFPSDTFVLSTRTPSKGIRWTNADPEPAKVVRSCPRCQARLSLPGGKKGRVRCPKCSNSWQAET